jgi:hypothetical protein
LASGPVVAAQTPLGQGTAPPKPAKGEVLWTDPAEPRLPDLRTAPPTNLYIERRGGTRLLRFANLVWNSGLGPLELTGRLNPESGKTQVTQRLYAPDESVQDVLVGEFVFHITHAHWHVEDFARYELWALDSLGRPARMAASGSKLSYCLIDTDRMDPDNPFFPTSRQYMGCGRVLQGMSPGWGDLYKADLDGQTIDISAVEDGVYALRSTANAGFWLLETNYTNNAATIYVSLSGNEVEEVEPPWLVAETCDVYDWC